MCVVAAVGGAALGSAVIGSMGAQSAADTQAQAASDASAAQLQASRESIAAQQQAGQQSQANIQPWINAGSGALTQLGNLLGIAITPSGQFSQALSGQGGVAGNTGSGGMATGGPTYGFSGAGSEQLINGQKVGGTGVGSPLSALENTPGYQFSLQQGLKAMENSAAARGMQLSGSTLQDLNTYAQGTAQQTYQQNVGNLMQLAGLGNSAGAAGASGALSTGAGIGNTLSNTGAQIGSNIIGAGNAAAAGQVGSANAISGALGGIGQLGQMYALSNLFGSGGGGGGNVLGAGGLGTGNAFY